MSYAKTKGSLLVLYFEREIQGRESIESEISNYFRYLLKMTWI